MSTMVNEAGGERIFFAVGNIAAHDGFVTSVLADDESWTEQEVCGSHGTILARGTDRAEVEAALEKWLECDSVPKGTYCYAHNPCAPTLSRGVALREALDREIAARTSG